MSKPRAPVTPLWQANYKSMSYAQLLAVQLPIGLTLQERADRLAFVAFEIKLKAPLA